MMQAEGGTVGAGLTCVGCAVTVGVGCDLALLKALMRPDVVVSHVLDGRRLRRRAVHCCNRKACTWRGPAAGRGQQGVLGAGSEVGLNLRGEACWGERKVGGGGDGGE